MTYLVDTDDSVSTQDFRAMLKHQPTHWLAECLWDWKRNGTCDISCKILAARCVAMVRAELMQRTPHAAKGVA